MAALPTTDRLRPMAPALLWNANNRNDENADDEYRNDHSSHQGDEDDDNAGGEDDHDPSDDDGVSGSQKAVGIRHPHVNDVLCGRGGLTNNHPGNEWFRKLVRSNRPLYHACPKHTKLLVSKAIVQAVQAQDPPGRFLEKRKDTLWYPVSYKKAVDKTSQGLREKERGDEVYQAPLPPMLASRSPKIPANLKDLARVTMARAGLDPILPSQSHAKRQLPAKPDAPPDVNPASKRPKLVPPVKVAEKPKAPSPPKITTPTLQEWDDPLPLPTQPLQTRQSSMFRFLRETPLFTSTGFGPAPPTFSTSSSSFMAAPAVAAAFAAAQASKVATAPAPWFYGTAMHPPPPPPPPAAVESSLGFPTESTVLTRLTSQFSDFFAPLWPQQSVSSFGGYFHRRQQHHHHHQQQHKRQQKHREALQSAETAATMMSFAAAPPTPSFAESDSIMIGSDGLAPLPLTFSKSASTFAAICNDDAIAEEIATKSKEEVQSTLPDDGIRDEETPTVVAPPSDLERSASATLLKLAANPTTFIHTLTDLFHQRKSAQDAKSDTTSGKDDAEEEDEVLPHPPASLPPFQFGAPTVGAAAASEPAVIAPLGRSAAKRSLLDDDEESPEESRLRKVGSM